MDEQEIRRLALQLACQLPDDAKEAIRVLHYAGRIITALDAMKPTSAALPETRLRLVRPADGPQSDEEDPTCPPDISSRGSRP